MSRSPKRRVPPMSDPRPCPFCGALPSHVGFEETRGHFVACGCLVQGPPSFGSVAEARAMWNTRAPDAQRERSGLVGLYFAVHVIHPSGVPHQSQAGWGRVDRMLPGGDVLLEYRDVENAGPALLPYYAVLLMEQAAPYNFFETEEEAERLFDQARALMRAMAPKSGTPPPGAGLPS